MEWSPEADKAVARIPFFVRRRVRKRVEDEARQSGADVIRPEHVKTCQQRFLDRMDREVKGYQVERCFGPGGCPNRAVQDDDLAERIEEILAAQNLGGFLRERVRGPLKIHRELRIAISDCPNACSRPQIVDLGISGAFRPCLFPQNCTACGLL